MPPTSRPTTTMCRRLSIRAFEFGRANAEARRAAAVVLLLARRVLQRHGCGTRLCGEHRHLLAALPLDHGDGRARVLELVVELDAHTRRIRVKGLVHLRLCGAIGSRLCALRYSARKALAPGPYFSEMSGRGYDTTMMPSRNSAPSASSVSPVSPVPTSRITGGLKPCSRAVFNSRLMSGT